MPKLYKYIRIFIILLTYSLTTELLSTKNMIDWEDISGDDLFVNNPWAVDFLLTSDLENILADDLFNTRENSISFSKMGNSDSNNINKHLYSYDDFSSTESDEKIRVASPILSVEQIEKTNDKKRKKDNLDDKEGVKRDEKKVKNNSKHYDKKGNINKRVASCDWTEEHEEYLKELKNSKNPNNRKKYTLQEIADEMNEEFSDKEFTKASVKARWRIIAPKTIKGLLWAEEHEEYLKELKDSKNPTNQKNYTWQEIADEMNKEFSDKEFTKRGVMTRWGIIQKEKK